MATKRIIFSAVIFLMTFPLTFCQGVPETIAGGRTKAPVSELTKYILFTSWYRERVIHVAIGNISDITQSLKVAIGTKDVQDHLFASLTLTLPSNSIKLVYFPLMKQKTPRGDLRTSDHVFIYGREPQGAGFFQFMTVQGISKDQPSINSFIASPGEEVRIFYALEPQDTLRIIFLPKSIIVNQSLLMSGKPHEGFLKNSTKEDFSRLDLPADYQAQIEEKLRENYGFLIRQGKGAGIAISYTIPEIKDCTVVRVPDYQYTFKPDGGVLYGAGPGLAFMIYNPKVVSLKSLLELSSEERALPAKK